MEEFDSISFQQVRLLGHINCLSSKLLPFSIIFIDLNIFYLPIKQKGRRGRGNVHITAMVEGTTPYTHYPVDGVARKGRNKILR